MKKTIRLALPAVALLVIAAALTRRHAPAAEPTDARVQQMLQERFGACDAPEAAPAVLAVDRDVRIEARTWTADVTPRGARVACADGFVHVSRGPALEMNRPADRTVEFMHADGVRERLEVRDDGLEQSFVFDSPVMGDIAVECAIDSDLDAACDETPGAGLVFSKDGVARLVYRKAMAIDAAGRTLDLSIAWNAGRVRMTIPAWWVETAAFPVVLDPVIGPATTVATGVSSYGSPTLGRYGSAYDASSNTYMTACQTGTNVRLQRVTAAGVLVGSATLFPGTHPQVAYSPSSSQYLVTYTSASIIRGRRYTNLGAPVGGEFTIGDAAGISDRFAHVVWGAARWLVVWQGGAIRGQFVNTDGTLSGAALDISGATPVFGAGGTGDTEPPRVGYASGTYLVVTRGTSSNYIAWRVSDSTSALVGGTISVGSGSFTRAPDVVGRSSATGARFVVTWVNNILIIPSIETRVRGRFVFTDGTLGTEIEYASNLADPSNSVIASLCSVGYSPSADEFLVAWGWDPNLSVSGDQSLRVQRVNVTTGAAIGGAEDVFSAVTSATDPVLAAGVNEQFLVLALNGSTQLGRIWGTSLPPTLTISSPAGGSTVGSTPLSVTGTAADTDGTIAGVAWTNSTSGVSGSASGAGTWSASVPLVAGANTIVFTATDSEGVTGTSTLAVTYTPAVPSIGLAPASLSFSGTAGGPNPAPQTVTLTNTGSGTLAWTATESLAWAGVAPSTGSLAAGASMTMTVSTSITGLGSGTYTGAISITAPGASNSPQSIPLTLTLTSSPTIGLSPSSLSFAGPTGGPNPAPQTLTITNTGGGTLAWTMSESLSWLSAAPASGSLTAGASGTSSVSVDVTGLAAGTYTGVLTITAPGATNSPQTVPVTLNVTALPTIALAPSSLTFTAPAGGPNPVSQLLTITNVGGGTLSWTLSESLSWLSGAPTGGALASGASGTSSIAVDVTGLAAGTYTGTLTLTAPGATNSPQTVPVTLNVTALPMIGLGATSLTFGAVQGGANPASQSITITNAGGGTLAWSAAGGPSWASSAPSSGSLASGAGQSMDVSVDATGLATGTYTGTLTVSAGGATNSPQVVFLVLTVSAAPQPPPPGDDDDDKRSKCGSVGLDVMLVLPLLWLLRRLFR